MALYAFDGTWNSEKDAGEYDRNTNVVRFKDLYGGPKYFYRGVGTKHGILGKFAGGAFCVGGHERIEDAKRDVEKPPVRFLGVWDVVAAFGIPINLGFNFNRINLGYKLGLSKGVKFCYHALALDEARQAFRPT